MDQLLELVLISLEGLVEARINTSNMGWVLIQRSIEVTSQDKLVAFGNVLYATSEFVPKILPCQKKATMGLRCIPGCQVYYIQVENLGEHQSDVHEAAWTYVMVCQL